MMLETYPMTIGGEAVRNERTLLAKVEDGELMQSSESVRFLILHCSATRRNQDYSVEQLMRDHKKRGFRTIGLRQRHRMSLHAVKGSGPDQYRELQPDTCPVPEG